MCRKKKKKKKKSLKWFGMRICSCCTTTQVDTRSVAKKKKSLKCLVLEFVVTIAIGLLIQESVGRRRSFGGKSIGRRTRRRIL
jgi:hypothetical protein